MSIINNGLLLASGADAAVGYQISRSIRLNSADSAYLSRTPGSAGNRKTWTLSLWIKRTKFADNQAVFAAGDLNGVGASLRFNTSDQLAFAMAGATIMIQTSRVFRDPSAWYHIVLLFDTTQATAANRMRLFVNGTEETAFASATYPTQNTDHSVNSTSAHQIGREDQAGAFGQYFNGYIADVYLLDGTATTPSTFAETNAITGQWVPKTPASISYGTNGFRLTFSDNSGTTSTTLGKDAAGSNNWTPNNFSVASGSGNDSLVDSPTSYGTDTGAGGEVRGNYATLNPLQNSNGDTFSNGNLDISTNYGSYGTHTSTVATPLSGKWYAEVTVNSSSGYTQVGLASIDSVFSTSSYLGSLNGVAYRGDNGNKMVDGVASSYGATYGTGAIIGIAYNADAGTVVFYKNGSSQGSITLTVRSYYFAGSDYNSTGSDSLTWNFGARPFAYTAPSGFKALVDTNLTAPTIAKPANYFDVKLYTGNGTSQTVSGYNFGPEFVWIKVRNTTFSHQLWDAIRGTNKLLSSDSTAAEISQTGGLTAFNSDGFSVGDESPVNSTNRPFVAWAWDAASSNSTNTSGTITSTVRANATAGFSIVTYSISSASATISTFGHGLGVAPSFVILKVRNAVDGWTVYHNGVSNPNSNWLRLDLTDAAGGNTSTFSSSSTTFGVRETRLLASGGSGNVVAYCFAPVANFSAISSWTGNGSSDGPFVFTGHRTRFLLYKRSDVANDWYIMDTARDTYNVSGTRLFPNLSNAEYTYTSTDLIDVTANGFKIRSSNAAINANGGTYIFMALAENPFQYARAR